jgi:VDE lipocalin domain
VTGPALLTNLKNAAQHLPRRCGDQYEDKAVTTFNCCAVSEKKCVPQQSTPDAYPVPTDTVLDTTFDLSQFQGRWYITAGYNKLFDTFDCQEHYFMSPDNDPRKVYGKIQWRINRPNGDFLERSTVQRFVQVCLSAWLVCVSKLRACAPRGAGMAAIRVSACCVCRCASRREAPLWQQHRASVLVNKLT